ncbi:MAG: hypothetical protein IPM35_16145 [Myxococcales bacterium]|nr:hypothetical protein [Myxococcales bacterium]
MTARSLGWVVGLGAALAACGGDDGGGRAGSGGAPSTGGAPSGGASSGGSAGTPTGGSSGGGTGGSGTGGGATGGASSGGGAGAGGAGTGGGANGDIPGGGTVLFQEKFDDASFTARGWYDGSQGTISQTEHAPGSTSSFQCAFAQGGTACSAGKPARHKITPSETVYASFWLKLSSNWVGSGKPYHPHMFHFINDLDGDWVGPSHTYLTTYMEVVAGKAFLGLQDSKNVDLNCILKNDDSFAGCNGNFATYPFTENRSVCACNGLLGDLQGRDCISNGNGTWYSSRSWTAANAWVDAAGPSYKGDWHFVEVYFAMNSIQGGKGVADGKIRWVQDGVTLIASDKILMRTNAHATLKFNQFAMLPYIGDGSPVAQSFWVDDLTVATARP